MMQGKRELRKRLLMLLLLPSAGAVYIIVNRINDLREASNFNVLKLPFDDIIPFNKLSAIPYFYWYILIAITAILLFRSKTDLYYKYILCSVTGMLLSCAIFIIYPTYVPRPAIAGNDLLSLIIQTIYAIDKPYNCFPSVHVVYATITLLFLYKYNHKNIWFNIWNIISFLGILASTLFMKQHYLPDVLSGAIIGVILFVLYEGLLFRKAAVGVEFLHQSSEIENE